MNNYKGIIGKLKLCVVRMCRSLLPLNAECLYEPLSEEEVAQRYACDDWRLEHTTTREEFETLRARVEQYEF